MSWGRLKQIDSFSICTVLFHILVFFRCFSRKVQSTFLFKISDRIDYSKCLRLKYRKQEKFVSNRSKNRFLEKKVENLCSATEIAVIVIRLTEIQTDLQKEDIDIRLNDEDE